MTASTHPCAGCNVTGKELFTCQHCSTGTQYCSVECERENWEKHQSTCRNNRSVERGTGAVTEETIDLVLSTLGTTPHSADKKIIMNTPFRCEEQPVKNKGNGMVATEDIPCGTVVLASDFIVQIKGDEVNPGGFDFDPCDDDFWDAYALQVGVKFGDLPQEKQEIYKSLCDGRTSNAKYRKGMEQLWHSQDMNVDFDKVFKPLEDSPDKSLMGIWITNALEAFGGAASSLYPGSQKFNHSCVANCNGQSAGFAHCVVTTRGIKKGEELCVNYIECDEIPCANRKAVMGLQWNFDCKCEVCDGTPAQIDESNKNRNELRELKKSSNLLKNTETLAKGLEWTKKKREIYEKENLWGHIRARSEIAFNELELQFSFKGEGLKESIEEFHRCMELKWGDKDEVTQKAKSWRFLHSQITQEELNGIAY